MMEFIVTYDMLCIHCDIFKTKQIQIPVTFPHMYSPYWEIAQLHTEFY